MTGMGFWKRDYLILDNEEDYNRFQENEQDTSSSIVELEELVEELYERIKTDTNYLCIDLFDDLTLLSLRDWLSNYIPVIKKCFAPEQIFD